MQEQTQKNHKNSKYWSKIECLKCGYKGKPLHNCPEFKIRYLIIAWLAVIYEIKFIIYLIKDWPARYSCPVCKHSRKNKHNIKYIYK